MKKRISLKAIKLLAAICLVVALFSLESFGVPNPGTETFTSITTAGQLGGNHPFHSDNTLNGPTEK